MRVPGAGGTNILVHDSLGVVDGGKDAEEIMGSKHLKRWSSTKKLELEFRNLPRPGIYRAYVHGSYQSNAVACMYAFEFRRFRQYIQISHRGGHSNHFRGMGSERW